MILFINSQVFDGSGAGPYAGEVLIQGGRIAAIARAGDSPLPRGNARVVDAAGATLMPGLTEAHAHLSWPSSVERFVPGMSLPAEDLLLNTARNARVLLDHGFTSAYSGGALGKTLEMTLKAHIDSGSLPGPRLVPSSLEREPPSDSAYLQGGKVEEHGRGPESVRAFVKECAEIGAKSVKFLLSGESALKPGASLQLMYTEDEIRAAGEQARESGVWLTGHAHAADAVKMGARNGFRVLYHCTYADAEALTMLEERKDSLFVAPTIGIVQATLDAQPPPHFDMTHMKNDAAIVLENQKKVVPQLRKRGVRLLPGGIPAEIERRIRAGGAVLDLHLTESLYLTCWMLSVATACSPPAICRTARIRGTVSMFTGRRTPPRKGCPCSFSCMAADSSAAIRAIAKTLVNISRDRAWSLSCPTTGWRRRIGGRRVRRMSSPCTSGRAAMRPTSAQMRTGSCSRASLPAPRTWRRRC
jgi:imidazolonepropionase-like amidohydrolase